MIISRCKPIEWSAAPRLLQAKLARGSAWFGVARYGRKIWAMIAISALCAWPAIAQVNALVSVPSGQAITLQEVIVDESATGKTLRLRFVAPHIVQEGADMEAAKDMDSLCETVALPHLEALGTPVNQIVISLSDRPVPFGEISPDAVQFFEAYSVGDGTCIWEGL